MLVVLKDRGKTLRFYKAGQIRLSAEVLYQFLKEEGWRQKEPWVSVYGPGGDRLESVSTHFFLRTDLHDREWVLDYFALAFATLYNYLVRVPKWLLYIISGGVGTFLLNFLHKPRAQGQSKAKPEAIPRRPATPPRPVPSKAVAKTTATSGQKTPNKRRGKK